MLLRLAVSTLIVAATLSCVPAEAEVVKPFDSHRDAQQDFLAAQKQAAAEHKNIFLDFGGNWCEACLYQYQVMHEDPKLAAQLKQGFVVIFVNVNLFRQSQGTAAIMHQFPSKIKKYPRLAIVSPEGKLLHEQGAEEFMIDPKKHNYDLDHAVIARFLDQWTPAQ